MCSFFKSLLIHACTSEFSILGIKQPHKFRMKIITYCLLLTATIIASCKPQSNTTTEQPASTDTLAKVDNDKEMQSSTCYMSAMGKDTFLLHLKRTDNVASGDLSYLFYEKDKQKGTFDGLFKGDTLVGDYVFASEGSTSTRQIAFLIRDDMAIEGYGELEEKNGQMFFKDIKSVQFGSGLRLNKVTCPQ
jgi:hypothetical protein